MADDHGGLDLGGLPVVCEHLGLTDPGELLHGFEVIKRWRHDRARKKD